jgi:hypothetical protein
LILPRFVDQRLNNGEEFLAVDDGMEMMDGEPTRKIHPGGAGIERCSDARLLGSPQRPDARWGVVLRSFRGAAAGLSMVPACAELRPPGVGHGRPPHRPGA